MTSNDKDRYRRTFGRNRLAMFLFRLSWIILGLIALSLFLRTEVYSKEGGLVTSRWTWKITLVLLFSWIVTAFLSYRLAGGRKNPIIWEDRSIFECLKYASESGLVRIGFHSMRDQEALLSALTAGIHSTTSMDVRQFIREALTANPKAYDLCRRYVLFQTISNGEQLFWNGNGEQVDVQFFHKAEIIVDIPRSAQHVFQNVLSGLSQS